MSYAGPASRGKRKPDIAPNKTAASVSDKAAPRPQARPSVETHDRSHTALFGAGVALGVVVGASIALLLAPQAGSDTRRLLKRRGRRIRQRSNDALDDLREEFRHALKRRRLAGLRSRHLADEEPHLD
jgi:hypothetical protein